MRLLLCFILLLFAAPVFSEEPFLKPNDVIALVGGEDMVVASELGYLEALIQRALPDHRLKFRSLAWEGDTVFEQRRDLNYPPLEAQLEKMGATVVIAQFGQMESLGGERGIPEFVSAYEKLVARLRGSGGRRVALISPTRWTVSSRALQVPPQQRGNPRYVGAVEEMAEKLNCRTVPSVINDFLPAAYAASRDGIHLAPNVHGIFASGVAADLLGGSPGGDYANPVSAQKPSPGIEKLRESIVAKNRLWHHYSRPQNWAFLAGDRTNQPSSRDHKDLSKRWFPDELEQFVPLIEAKEKEIWELAAKLKN